LQRAIVGTLATTPSCILVPGAAGNECGYKARSAGCTARWPSITGRPSVTQS
jgi:hypothetical protein